MRKGGQPVTWAAGAYSQQALLGASVDRACLGITHGEQGSWNVCKQTAMSQAGSRGLPPGDDNPWHFLPTVPSS